MWQRHAGHPDVLDYLLRSLVVLNTHAVPRVEIEAVLADIRKAFTPHHSSHYEHTHAQKKKDRFLIELEAAHTADLKSLAALMESLLEAVKEGLRGLEEGRDYVVRSCFTACCLEGHPCGSVSSQPAWLEAWSQPCLPGGCLAGAACTRAPPGAAGPARLR